MATWTDPTTHPNPNRDPNSFPGCLTVISAIPFTWAPESRFMDAQIRVRVRVRVRFNPGSEIGRRFSRLRVGVRVISGLMAWSRTGAGAGPS